MKKLLWKIHGPKGRSRYRLPVLLWSVLTVCLLSASLMPCRLMGKQDTLVFRQTTAESDGTLFSFTGYMPEDSQAHAISLGNGCFDLFLTDSSGREYQPQHLPVRISTSLKASSVFHRTGCGWEQLAQTEMDTGVSFDTDHFSLFVLTRSPAGGSSEEILDAPVPVEYVLQGRMLTEDERVSLRLPDVIPCGSLSPALSDIENTLSSARLGNLLIRQAQASAFIRRPEGDFDLQVQHAYMTDSGLCGAEEAFPAVLIPSSGNLRICIEAETFEIVSELTLEKVHAMMSSFSVPGLASVPSDSDLAVTDQMTPYAGNSNPDQTDLIFSQMRYDRKNNQLILDLACFRKPSEPVDLYFAVRLSDTDDLICSNGFAATPAVWTRAALVRCAESAGGSPDSDIRHRVGFWDAETGCFSGFLSQGETALNWLQAPGGASQDMASLCLSSKEEGRRAAVICAGSSAPGFSAISDTGAVICTAPVISRDAGSEECTEHIGQFLSSVGRTVRDAVRNQAEPPVISCQLPIILREDPAAAPDTVSENCVLSEDGSLLWHPAGTGSMIPGKLFRQSIRLSLGDRVLSGSMPVPSAAPVQSIPVLRTLRGSVQHSLGSDVTIQFLDADGGTGAAGKLEITDMDGHVVWTSGDLAQEHVVPFADVPFEPGSTYLLRQTEARSGYSLPGFAWTLTTGEDYVISATSALQTGSGKAESLGMASMDGKLTILNELSPQVRIHMQCGTEDIQTLELLAGDPDPQLPDPVMEGYAFRGWGTRAGTLNLLTSQPALSTAGGAVNHVYATWNQNLTIGFYLYTWGKIQEAELVEDSMQTVHTGMLEAGEDLIINSRISGIVRIPAALQGGNYLRSRTCLSSSQSLEPLKRVCTVSQEENACLRWELTEVTTNAHTLLSTSDHICIYVYPKNVQIPLVFYELQADGTYLEQPQMQTAASLTVDAAGTALSQTKDFLSQDYSNYDISDAFLCKPDPDSEDMFHDRLGNWQTLLQYFDTGLSLSDYGSDAVQVEDAQDRIIVAIVYRKSWHLPVVVAEKTAADTYAVRDEWREKEYISIDIYNQSYYTTYQDKTRVLKEEMRTTLACLHVYYGADIENMTETEVVKLKAVANGVQINDDGVILTEDDHLFFLYYPNPRPVPVHVAEYTAEGYINRDEAWEVQPVSIPDTDTTLTSLEPRMVPDDAYGLYKVYLVTSGNVENGREALLAKNTEDGMSVKSKTASGAVDPKFRLLTGELYFIYYQKTREIPVVYLSAASGTRTVLPPVQLDYAGGHAVETVACGETTSTDVSQIGSPAFAVTDGGRNVYRPNFGYAFGKADASPDTLSFSSAFPSVTNTALNFKQNKKNKSLDHVIYVLYDDAMDTAPAYMLLENTSEDAYTFVLEVNGGQYTRPVMLQSSQDGTWSGSYTFTLSSQSDVMLYLPGAGGLSYSVRILDGEGNEVQSALADHDLELSTAPVSAPLTGTLATGPSYFWSGEGNNVYTNLRSETASCTRVILSDMVITLPSPTGLSILTLPWVVLLLFAFGMALFQTFFNRLDRKS